MHALTTGSSAAKPAELFRCQPVWRQAPEDATVDHGTEDHHLGDSTQGCQCSARRSMIARALEPVHGFDRMVSISAAFPSQQAEGRCLARVNLAAGTVLRPLPIKAVTSANATRLHTPALVQDKQDYRQQYQLW
jgi:hypothetical protein